MTKLRDKLYEKYCPDCEKPTEQVEVIHECGTCKSKDCIFVCKECIKKIKERE